MPTKSSTKLEKQDKIIGSSIDELSRILKNRIEDDISISKSMSDDEKDKTLDRIKARKIRKSDKKFEISEKEKEDALNISGDVLDSHSIEEKKEKSNKKATKTTTKSKPKIEEKVEGKTKIEEKVKSKTEEKTKTKAKTKTKIEEKIESKVEIKAKDIQKSDKKSVKSVENSEKTPKLKKITKVEKNDEIAKTEKTVKIAKNTKDTPKTVSKTAKKSKKASDISLNEILDNVDDENLEDINIHKEGIRTLKNISKTIRNESNKRRKRKSDTAQVMAAFKSGKVENKKEEEIQIMPGFPVDVSHIDVEKERYEAEEECIEEFKRIVNQIRNSRDIEEAKFEKMKDGLISNLIDMDKDLKVEVEELKSKQGTLVAQIAEIREVLAIRQKDLNNLGFTQFIKKNKLKEFIKQSENEIGTLEMEALQYNNKLSSIMEDATKKRQDLFLSIEDAKKQSKYANEKLENAMMILQKMENRQQMDENEIQKKLILNALNLYKKPITIGQLLYYPGLSGYSVQKMSSAINQLVNNDKKVLKVALEDNVYYLIANKDDNI